MVPYDPALAILRTVQKDTRTFLQWSLLSIGLIPPWL